MQASSSLLTKTCLKILISKYCGSKGGSQNRPCVFWIHGRLPDGVRGMKVTILVIISQLGERYYSEYKLSTGSLLGLLIQNYQKSENDVSGNYGTLRPNSCLKW